MFYLAHLCYFGTYILVYLRSTSEKNHVVSRSPILLNRIVVVTNPILILTTHAFKFASKQTSVLRHGATRASLNHPDPADGLALT